MRRFGIVLSLVFLAGPALADGGDGLSIRYRCPIAETLARLEMDRTVKNRFLVVGRRDAPQDYVQCLFLPDRTHLLCEAASGHFFKGTNILTPAGRAAVARLGFAGDGADGNYQRMIALDKSVSFTAIAELLLDVQRRVYGAGDSTMLDMEAPPLGPPNRPLPVCEPVS